MRTHVPVLARTRTGVRATSVPDPAICGSSIGCLIHLAYRYPKSQLYDELDQLLSSPTRVGPTEGMATGMIVCPRSVCACV